MTCKVTVCTPGDSKYERKSARLVFVNVALLRNVQTVQELYHIKSANYSHKSITPHSILLQFKKLLCPYLPNILVSYSANLLDIRCALGDILERVARQLQLILLVL
jgi:hypothetical protein